MTASSPSETTPSSLPATAPLSKVRWATALLLGIVLAVSADVAAQFIPLVLLDLPPEGLTFALVGVLKLTLGLSAVALGLRLVRLRFRDVGFVADHWRSDVWVGFAVAAVFALVQFLVIIPLTGGADRSDIVVESARIGDSLAGVVGLLTLSWMGVFFEELFFRGLIFNTLRGVLGPSRLALYAVVAITTLLFAAGHGYQGWAGVLDTGFYGGLTLTLLYVWRGRLTACIVAHALWNTFAVVAIYLWY